MTFYYRHRFWLGFAYLVWRAAIAGYCIDLIFFAFIGILTPVHILIAMVFLLGFVALRYCQSRACKPPVLTHQLIGVRGFHLSANGLLSSLTGKGDWEPGDNVAVCKAHQDAGLGIVLHTPPGPTCHCGFNVYTSLAELRASPYAYEVAAVVEGWGPSRLHPDGWRAEKARIVALVDEQKLPYFECDPFSSTSVSTESQSVIIFKTLEGRPRLLMQAASLRYDVPIITARQAANSLDEFGTSVPDNLKPGGQHR